MKSAIAVFMLTFILTGCEAFAPSGGVYLKIHNQEGVSVLIEDGASLEPFVLGPGEVREVSIETPRVPTSGRPDPYLPEITIVATSTEELPVGCAPRTDDLRLRFPRDPGEWDSKFWDIRLSRYDCDNSVAGTGILVEVINSTCSLLDIRRGNETLIANLPRGSGETLIFRPGDVVLDEVVLFATNVGKPLPEGCEEGVEVEEFRFRTGRFSTETWNIRRLNSIS